MIDLDEIERRANAATPGPWYVHESDRPGDYWTVSADPDWPFDCEVFDDGSAGGEYGPSCSIEDRDFLVAARTDVPALIARVRELEEEREQIRARLEEECERTRGLEHERDAYERSHLILKGIHGAIHDECPKMQVPPLDSFDVVETVRGLAIALEATETMLVAFLDRAERVILDGQEWVERNRGTVNMTQRAKKSKTFETNAFTRAPMTLVDYGLAMWVCAVCDKCAVFNRQAGKPNGWRADRCPECQGADE